MIQLIETISIKTRQILKSKDIIYEISTRCKSVAYFDVFKMVAPMPNLSDTS